MNAHNANDNPFSLDDGSRVAVIGGGPAGSFFSIFALKMAKMIGKELDLTIFEPKDFTQHGPGGCNRCGGIISELLVQTLAVEGINLPDTVVRKGINSYKLHTHKGHVFISTPAFEKTIATVYRGGGPKGVLGEDKESFDHFLLTQAILEGAIHEPIRIDHIEYTNNRPILFSNKEAIMEADLVVGAFGVNSNSAKIFQRMGFGYTEPPTVKAAIAEIKIDAELISECFGDSINLFLLPDKEIEFAALIPKGGYVTLCILGKGLKADIVSYFMKKPVVNEVIPDTSSYSIECRCLPNMNVGAPKKPFTDRIVMCGDAGSTRLFKDGLGATYLTGKAAAKTALLVGVGEEDFKKNYLPVYKSIIYDNYYGVMLYTIIDAYRKTTMLTKAMLRFIEKEQDVSYRRERILSTVMWDMFTGNERYKNVFLRFLKPRMHINMWAGLIKSLMRG